MRHAVSAAVVLAALCACAGYSNGPVNVDPGGIPIGGNGDGGNRDGGDGGLDGGDGGPDAGDAGCTALALNTASIVDHCFGSGGTFVGSVSVNTAACTVDIQTGAGGVCTGTVSGVHDAFDGGCGSLPCSAPSLPGTINCGSCLIVICDAGAACP